MTPDCSSPDASLGSGPPPMSLAGSAGSLAEFAVQPWGMLMVQRSPSYEAGQCCHAYQPPPAQPRMVMYSKGLPKLTGPSLMPSPFPMFPRGSPDGSSPAVYHST